MILTLEKDDDFDKIILRARVDYEQKRVGVKEIIEGVRQGGNKSLFYYTEKFDGFALTEATLRVSEREISEAYNFVDKKTLSALRAAKRNITKFHAGQLRKSKLRFDSGKSTGYIIKPVERAGIYVPGGKAAYPSTVLMCAVPAIVAGVKEIIMTTPGKHINPLTLVAARECGIEKIYRIGGAQAVAAMAYGTETVPKVNVISGPGNIYVALAKREVYGQVGIDMIAGPSEILIVADESADARFIAADMLSQAEHDAMAMSTLITTDKNLALAVKEELKEQLSVLPKHEIAEKALDNYGAIAIVDTIEEALALANRIAPEHLELCFKDAENRLKDVENAGAVFVGNYSPEPLGDYYAGPNHVLPTGGTAHYASSLGVDNYIKRINVIRYDKQSLQKASGDIIRLAETEELTAHANAVKVRFEIKE